MAGYTLRSRDAHDDAKLTQFVGNVHSLFDRMHLLSRWAADRVRTNLERISIAGDTGLAAYLALVEEQRRKEGVLKGLVRYMQEAIL